MTSGLTAALTLPAVNGAKPTCYLFQGTWAARYTQDGQAWTFDSPFGLPQHVCTLWPGLAATVGHHPYVGAFTAKNEIYFLRPDHLVRYNIAKDKVESADDAKPGNTFKLDHLGEEFLKSLSGAMDTPKGIYLFSGPRWALFQLNTGALRKQGTLSTTVLTGVDGACWLPGADSGYLFREDRYYTCTAADDGTLTAAAGGAITDLWKGAPLRRPLADLYAAGDEARLPVRFRTDLDLSTDAGPSVRTVKAEGTVIQGDGLKTAYGRACWSVSPDGKHAFLTNQRKVVVVDLDKVASGTSVIRGKDVDQALWDAVVTGDGNHLWVTNAGMTDSHGKTLHDVDVSEGGAATDVSHYIGGAAYGLALSAKGDRAFVGVERNAADAAVVVVNTGNGSTISTLPLSDPDGKAPQPIVRRVAVTPDGGTVFAARGDGSVAKLKGTEPLVPIPLTDLTIRDLAVSSDGRQLCAVAPHDDGSVAIVDTETNAVRRAKLPHDAMDPCGVVIDPNGGFAYVAGYIRDAADDAKGRVWVVDLTSAELAATVEADWGAERTPITYLALGWRWA
ncbi:YncE family protein [Streptantibioticus ferralitis]|uniref:YncE family protein n=1 Tax=Streptantibioticus ferralitis TaxID=236510 RepID=A0ABT5Z0Q4_9ACTN|nr:YncE family protein [Streptantibioticus ferralitis]MDF2257425.1 YncE family protein [Streptantibioticus ferralitis]